jgi:transposase
MRGELSIFEFQKLYPSDEACMGMLFNQQYGEKPCPHCKKKTKFYHVKTRRFYECGGCGHQIYPTKGTILEGSKVSLEKWLYAIHLMVKSKNAVSAIELQGYIGVSYKVAWRMAHKIRSLMGDVSPELFCGIVEVDETYIGGKRRKRVVGYNGRENKVIVFGIRERKRPGRVKAFIVKNTSKMDLLPLVEKYVEKGSIVYSDEHAPYKALPELGYRHDFVTHKNFQWDKNGVTTNRIEGFWSFIKNSVRGTYKHVSKNWLENYLREYMFRYNNREVSQKEQFERLLEKLFSVRGLSK